MKNYLTFLLFVIMFCPAIILAQGKKVKTIETGSPIEIFQKGNSLVDLNPNLGFSQMVTNQNPNITTTRLNLNIRGNYFVKDQIGVVAGVYVNNINSNANVNLVPNSNNFLFEAGARYGFDIGKVPLYAELTGGLGTHKNEFDQKASVVAYNVGVTALFPVGQIGTHAKASIGYAGKNNTFDSSKEKQSGVYLCGGFVQPLGCDDYGCDLDDDEFYDRGSNLLQFDQRGLLGLGTQVNETSAAGSTFKVKDGLFGYKIRLSDIHYVADNLGVGLTTEFEGLTNSSKNSDYKIGQRSYCVMPVVRYHAPVDNELKHLYAEVGYAVGSVVNFTSNNGNENKVTQNISGFNFGLGYNVPFSKRFMVSAYAGYNTDKIKIKDTDFSYNSNGPEFTLGMSYQLLTGK